MTVDRLGAVRALAKAEKHLAEAHYELVKPCVAFVALNLTDAATQTLEKLKAVRYETEALRQSMEAQP